MNYFLYNPKADGNNGDKNANEVLAKLEGEYKQLAMTDLDFNEFCSNLEADDKVTIMGGDGTLNYFINHVPEGEPIAKFYLFPFGTGNDFARDIDNKEKDGTIFLNPYLENIPYVTVNEKTYRFLNGIGYGIDGQCCEVADQRAAQGKKVNYSSISVGLIFHGYKPRTASVTVDGETKYFEKVYLASGMHGRYYGGGMKVAPNQKRNSGELSCVIVHGKGKIGTLLMFPKIMSGNHLKYKNNVAVLTGKDIRVEFDVPCALQVDGETILNVKEYHAYFK